MSESRDAGRSTFSLLFQSPLVFSVLCPLSFAATGFFLGTRWDPNRVRLWHLLMALQPAFWLTSLLVVFNDFRRHRLDLLGRRSERTAVLLCTLLAWVMTSFPYVVQLITQQWGPLTPSLEAALQLPHLRVTASILGLFSSAVVTLHTAGMLDVHVQLLAYSREPMARTGGAEAARLDDEVLRYLWLRARLERFLLFSAVIIGLATLGLGAFRNMLVELAPPLLELFESSRVLGYGVYYTALLASVYLPTRKTLTDVGEALAARFVPPFPSEGTSWKNWSEEQRVVRTWLGLERTPLQDFQQGLSVLAPLLASLSALALGVGG